MQLNSMKHTHKGMNIRKECAGREVTRVDRGRVVENNRNAFIAMKF